MDYSKVVGPRHKQSKAHQMEKVREDQVQNNAGGYVFQVNPWDRLDRFLILGVEGNTYYQSAKALIRENAQNIEKLVQENGIAVVNRIVEISDSGRAPKNDPALFVLAMAAGVGNADTRKAALEALPQVARIGTHLFHFTQYVEGFRGWGRGLRRAVANWYNEKDLVNLQYQVMKYQQRDGWSHRDLLRLSHPKANSYARNMLYQFIVKGEADLHMHDELRRIKAAQQCKQAVNAKQAVQLIEDYNLPREVVNTELLNSKQVWAALLERMPIGAMIRNLGKMSSIGLLEDLSDAEMKVVSTLTNNEILKKARVHPLSLLSAMKTYGQGHGVRGSLSWKVNQNIMAALEQGFYRSFFTIEPTGKRWMLGIDVSVSMSCGNVAGIPNLMPSEAAAVMAMVTARTENRSMIMGFADTFRDLGIKSIDSLDVVQQKTRGMTFSATDCALPMLYAMKNKIKVDMFVIYTDSETWFGVQHPMQALKEYRNRTGINAKLAVVAFTGNDFTIADPQDAGSIDFVGMDASGPQILADFARGDI